MCEETYCVHKFCEFYGDILLENVKYDNQQGQVVIFPYEIKFSLDMFILKPIRLHNSGLRSLICDIILMNFSVVIGVGGYECPSCCNIYLM